MSKIKAQRRDAIESDKQLESDAKSDQIDKPEPSFIFYDKPLTVKCKIYISGCNYASYYQHIDTDITNVYLYKLLTSYADAHQKIIATSNYKRPFDTNGFTFTTHQTVKYFDANRIVNLNTIINRCLLAAIKITPYNYCDNSGLSIKILTARTC